MVLRLFINDTHPVGKNPTGINLVVNTTTIVIVLPSSMELPHWHAQTPSNDSKADDSSSCGYSDTQENDESGNENL